MIEAIYFDGKSGKPHSVRIAFQNSNILIQGYEGYEGEVLRHPLIHCYVDEGFKGAAQRIDLGAGAVLEVKDKVALQKLLDAQGLRLGMVQKVQNSWAWVGGGVALFIGVLALSYYILIPFGARHVASWLPESIDKMIGDQSWGVIEGQMFTASKLPVERQKEITDKFAAVTQSLNRSDKHSDKPLPSYQLFFRASQVGPNAIAIPGGRLVMTDELVALSKDDSALIGVLLHELGHIKNRHSMRNIIQATAISAIVSLWLGDVSAIVATVPTMMATMKYSRDLETEADDFAISSLKTLKIPGQAVGDLFLALEKTRGEGTKGGTNDGKASTDSILSSHPVTTERIKKFNDIK
jgi:Zn-dependent protease with chaperone function